MPRLEFLKIADESYEGEFLVVHLFDPQEFNIEEFDIRAGILSDRYKQPGKSYSLKFIVHDDQMHLFPIYNDNFGHFEAEQTLQARGISSWPQSAGSVERRRKDYVGNEYIREICDWSCSLSAGKLLSKVQSDQYKTTVIAQNLGKFFCIR